MNNTLRQKSKQTTLNQLSIKALQALDKPGFKLGNKKDPILYFYYQVARMNPFQRLLYSSAWENGFSPIPVLDFEELFSVEFQGKKVLHIHWVSNVLSDVISSIGAQNKIEKYLAKIAKLQQLGFTIVWTLHNIVSHASTIPKEEYKLREQLGKQIDILHVLTKNTTTFTNEYYSLPEEKIIYHPHPSYEEAYSNFISKTEARYDLGISNNDTVFLIFGSIQKYKGVEGFLKVFTKYKEDNPLKTNVKAIIAGIPSDKILAKVIQDTYGYRDDIILDLNNIENSEVQYYMNSADYVVCPYGRSLNSGVGILALSFYKPIIAPYMAGFIELIENHSSFGTLYSEDAGNTLYDIIKLSEKESHKINTEQIKKDFSKYNARNISNDFFTDIRRILENEGN